MSDKLRKKHKRQLKCLTKNELRFISYKIIIYNRRLPLKLRESCGVKRVYHYNNLTRHRCIINNRSRAVYSKFNLSRIPIKTNAFSGFINGYMKSSW